MTVGRTAGGVEWLLVCLGNYGRRYEDTRHNVGFMAADALIGRNGLRCNRLRFKALTEDTELGGSRVLLMKPQTYMNLSGEAAGEAARFYKLPPERVLTISDDVSLPLGRLRVRAGGSAGGHNGLRSIIEHLGTDRFPRIRVGVGAPPDPGWDMADWVLGSFGPDERKTVLAAAERAVDAAACVIGQGVAEAQSRFNG